MGLYEWPEAPLCVDDDNNEMLTEEEIDERHCFENGICAACGWTREAILADPHKRPWNYNLR